MKGGKLELKQEWIGRKDAGVLRDERASGKVKAFFGVIAGTPVDTKMGVECLGERGHEALGLAGSSTPEEQARMQIMDPKQLTQWVGRLIERLTDQGADGIMIYCNSMSTAVDLPRLKKMARIPVITPLDVYLELAREYRILGVIAANNQSLAGIERTLQAGNPDCWQIGCALLPVVLEIEAGLLPEEIVKKNKLMGVFEAMKAMGGEALLLGCTHFPYMKEEIERYEILPIIDPADRMTAMLVSGMVQGGPNLGG